MAVDYNAILMYTKLGFLEKVLNLPETINVANIYYTQKWTNQFIGIVVGLAYYYFAC